MIKSSTAVKARIKNRVGENSDKAQIMLRIYLMERLLERVSVSKYRDNFVLKAHWLYSKFGDGEYQDIPGLCKIAYTTSDENDISIEEKGWSLTPGAYVGVAPVKDDGVDFEERMAEIHQELLSLQAESNDLMDVISKNMKEMGL